MTATAAAAPATTLYGKLDFGGAVRQGLAADGGLLVPETFPAFSASDLDKMRYLSYPELAVRIMRAFTGNSLRDGELAGLVQDAYSRFSHPDITPLTKVNDRLSLLELFHGPTLAFKDVALQFLGRVFGHFADVDGARLTVVGATSGDTGSAAIEGCRGIAGVRVFILYPAKGPSDVQRRQMTTVASPNVHALAVDGSFDDCQALVKQLFNDPAARARMQLTAVNSINWARILAQVVYYFYAGLKAGALQQPVNFVVPTGNFGNVYAGYVAKRLGLPIAKLVIATNSNASVAQFINDGVMQPGLVTPTISPSMDIQIASNAERYVYEVLDRDGEAVAAAMQQLKTGAYHLPENARARIANDFMAMSVTDAETESAMRSLWDEKRMLIDPHTGVGVYAARQLASKLEGPIVALACAHPAKFPETVQRVTGQQAGLPPELADLYQRPERITSLANNYAALLDVLEQKS